MHFITTLAARAQNVLFAASDGEFGLADRAQNVWAVAHDEEGQTLVEYALIISLIALGVIAALLFLKNRIVNLFSSAGNSLG